jgi:hypothetical protein
LKLRLEQGNLPEMRPEMRRELRKRPPMRLVKPSLSIKLTLQRLQKLRKQHCKHLLLR